MQLAVILPVNLLKNKLSCSDKEATVWGEHGLCCRVIGRSCGGDKELEEGTVAPTDTALLSPLCAQRGQADQG